MKQVVVCKGCGKITRKYGSYKAMLNKDEDINGIRTGRKIKEEIKLCKDCNTKAGYKR